MTLKEAELKMLADLQKSLLTKSDAKKLLFKPVLEGHNLAVPNNTCYQLPYWNPDGTPSGFYRVRYLEYTPSKGWGALIVPEKPRRYSQPAGSGLHIYLPPLCDRPWADIMQDPKIPLIITEGEKKAACMCKLGHPTIGLGGVFNFSNARELQELIPELEAFVWEARPLISGFDSDIATNPMIMLAASKQSVILAKRGTMVGWIKMPPAADGSKQGLDDLAFNEGPEAVEAILHTATPLGPGIDLHRMNSEVALIRSTSEIVELTTGFVHSPANFANVAYSPRTYVVSGAKNGMAYKSTAKEWLTWPLRTEVPRVEYEPGTGLFTANGAFNTWSIQGWGCKPSNDGNVALWEKFFNHIFTGATEAHKLWVKQWLAYPLQHPGAKLSTAILLWGRTQGPGKTKFAETMRTVYGRNYGTASNTNLLGNFNEWAENASFIVIDEVEMGDKRSTANIVKDMVTRTSVRINIKNRKSFVITDHINYWFNSNRSDALYLELQDRRMFVHNCIVDQLPQSFYDEYFDWLYNRGGGARLFYHLLNEVSLAGFQPYGRAPVTAAKLEMTASGRSDAEDWCLQLKINPDSISQPKVIPPYDLFRTVDLLKLYDPNEHERIKPGGFGRALGAVGVFSIANGQNNAIVDNARTRLWAVRNVERYKRTGAVEAGRIYADERANHKGRKFESNGTLRRVQ